MANNRASTTSYQLIPIFDGDKYEFWNINMKTLFESKELWDLVEKGYAEEDEAQRLLEKKKRTPSLYFTSSKRCMDSIFSKIHDAKISKQA